MGAKRVSKQGVTVSTGNAIEVTNTTGSVLFSVDSTGSLNTLPNLTAKGSILTASAANTPATLAVGANGYTLVADSAASTGLGWSGNIAAAKNICINGSMDIWQRGTSFSGSGIYTADRWYSGVGNTTYAQETSVIPSGFRYAMKMTTSAINTAPTIWQAVETANCIAFAGQNVILSFYARSTDSVNALVRLDYSTGADTGIGGSYTQITASASSVTTNSTGYTRVWATFAIPSTAQTLRLILGAGANLSNGGSFYMTGVQLELGTSITTFTRAGGTIAGELAACKYYFKRMSVNSGVFGYALGMAQSGTSSMNIFPGVMRTTPTSTINGTLRLIQGNSDYAITGINNTYFTSLNDAVSVNFTLASGLTAGYANCLYASTSGVSFDLSAEL